MLLCQGCKVPAGRRYYTPIHQETTAGSGPNPPARHGACSQLAPSCHNVELHGKLRTPPRGHGDESIQPGNCWIKCIFSAERTTLIHTSWTAQAAAHQQWCFSPQPPQLPAWVSSGHCKGSARACSTMIPSALGFPQQLWPCDSR